MTDTALQTSGDVIEASDAVEHQVEASVRVVTAVADATDADPTTMEPLFEAVDPDALDQLVAAGIEGHVNFEFCDHDVTVHGDGTIFVDGDVQRGA